VWPVRVVVIDEDAEDVFQVGAVQEQEPVEALAAGGADEALSDPFAFGARTGVLMIRTPLLAKTASKLRVNLASWSRIRKRKRDGCSWSFQENLRACWVTHSPVGLAVQPAR
jgi:hypothetical protein